MDTFNLTDAQIQRAEAAFLPFIRAWNLPMNPEEADEVIYALFSHVGNADASDDEEELQRIIGDVEQQLHTFKLRHQQLLQAHQASIDQRNAEARANADQK